VIVASTLVGYTGGELGVLPFDTQTNYAGAGGEGGSALVSGELFQPTPEPASLTLLASSLAAAGGLVFVRRRGSSLSAAPDRAVT
jgi:hypothetical protein